VTIAFCPSVERNDGVKFLDKLPTHQAAHPDGCTCRVCVEVGPADGGETGGTGPTLDHHHQVVREPGFLEALAVAEELGISIDELEDWRELHAAGGI